VATDMDGGAVTASTNGAVMAVSAAAGRFVVVKPGGRVDTAESTTITGLPQTASLTLTAVGDRPVALDADSGTLVLPDGSTDTDYSYIHWLKFGLSLSKYNGQQLS